jgi:DNA relaxase NicK
VNPSKTTIDWLRFRTQSEPRDGLEALRPLYGDIGSALRLDHYGHGRDGWRQSASVCIADLVVGRVDYGGESQRGWVRWNITGKGCEWVRDWDAIDEVEALPGAQIKRLDVALTTWDGQVSHERVRAAHAAGSFRRGGRPPELQTIESTDPRAGRTCYVGKRERADQFFRGYEKGFELAGKHSGMNVTHIGGHAVEDIYRCEVEFKDQTREIGWDTIERRDQYFAGAYPFLAELLPEVECDILMRRPERAPQRDLAVALANVKLAYGNTLYTALRAFGGDIGRVWDSIVGVEHNKALLEAGVMLVEHEEIGQV